MHLLNLDYPPELGCQLCCQVLATLTALLAGNEASRNRVRDDVGYDTLFSIITRVVGSTGPSEELLVHMLGFTLEVSPAHCGRPASTVAGGALGSLCWRPVLPRWFMGRALNAVLSVSDAIWVNQLAVVSP